MARCGRFRCPSARHEPRWRPGDVGSQGPTVPEATLVNAAAERPAFYAVGRGTGGLRDWVTLLHPPYTLWHLSLIHISEPTRLGMISYAVFCLKKKNKK